MERNTKKKKIMIIITMQKTILKLQKNKDFKKKKKGIIQVTINKQKIGGKTNPNADVDRPDKKKIDISLSESYITHENFILFLYKPKKVNQEKEGSGGI